MVSIQEWTELGYTYEQAKELNRVSRLGGKSNNIIDANSASESLVNTMKQFELNQDDESRKIIEKLNEI